MYHRDCLTPVPPYYLYFGHYLLLNEFIMDAHEPLEIAHSLHPELQRRVLVHNKDGLGVLLESGNGPHMVDTLLYRFV